MNRPRFILSPEAVADLDEIWLFIAKDNMDAANRNEEELRAAMVSWRANRMWGMSGRTSRKSPLSFGLSVLI